VTFTKKKKRCPYRVLMGKIEGKRPLGKTRCKQGILKWILKK
jgi:hypothetical protein